MKKADRMWQEFVAEQIEIDKDGELNYVNELLDKYNDALFDVFHYLKERIRQGDEDASELYEKLKPFEKVQAE